MTCYRVESSCSRTGAYQHVQVLDSFEKMIGHCTEPWRAASTHVVTVLQPGLQPRISHVFTGGVCVSDRHLIP
jgi:hypothetical protein